MNELEILKNRLDQLENEISSLKSSSTISWEVDQAFRHRLLNGLQIPEILVSSKGIDSEDISVDTSAPAVYTVMNDPDGFLEIVIDETTYYIPIFT